MARAEWKSIDFNPQYEASTTGKIRNGVTGQILAMWYNPDGYARVNIPSPLKGGKLKRAYVHQLVAEAHIGPRPKPPKGHKLMVVHHRDDNPRNNRSRNLQYITNSENIRLGIQTRGGKRRRLTALRKAILIERIDQGVRMVDICTEFDVSPPNVRRIKRELRSD